MSRYKIAWLPGDGVGVDVMDATRIVLDRLKLDAEYIHGDIGWEFWCAEGDAFPARTIELLKNVDAALFGAITSKPVKAAEAELVPSLRGTGLVYRSPIVRMRQLFDLYICLRPCKAYPGNPLNLKDAIDIVVFRENTEDLYAGVEFNPVPDALADTLRQLSKPFAHFAGLKGDEYAVSCKINTRKGSERIIDAAFAFARKHGRKKVTVVHKANVVRATDGMFLEIAREVGRALPRDHVRRSQRRRDDDVAAEEPAELRRARRAEPVRRHRLRPLRPDGRRPRLRVLGQHRRRSSPCSSPRTGRRRSTRANTRSIRSPRFSRPR